MRRLGLLVMLVLAFPGAASAATPASGSVSTSSPSTSWEGTLTAGYPSYAALVLADVGGAAGDVPCAPASCDSFELTVEDAGQDLLITAASPDTNIVTLRVTGPDGSVRYDNGFAEEPVTSFKIRGAEAGLWRVDVTTNALDTSAYTATASLSPGEGGPQEYPSFTYEKVRVPMRDGVELSAEIYRPVVPEGTEVPVILHLTPYHVLSPIHGPTVLPLVDGVELVRKGYAFVFADVRGTWASGGCWDYGGIKERQDGYDLVEYLGTRDWSNGKVAMMGASYPGTTPNAAAVEQPPHLATIIPVSAISRWWGYAYQQGTRATYSGESADIDPPSDTPTDFMFAYGFLPPPDPTALLAADQTAMRWNLCDRVEQTLHGYDTQPNYDDFWKERDYLRRADRVKVPVLLSHGLLDFNVKTWEGTAWWEAIDGPKMMVLGQWPHAYPGSYYDQWQPLLERWLDRWLRGIENGVEDEPRVHVQTQDGVWHLQENWGSKVRASRALPLSGGEFQFVDDGALTESEVLRGVGEGVRWARVPVANSSGLRFGGRPVLRLRAKSDSPSTHFTAVLCDVGPGGACKVISRAFMNARYRGGRDVGEDLAPGEWTEFDLEFIDKDWVVAPDHSLELRIASSSNTWVAPNETRATNTLDLDGSELVLPVYDGE